MEQSLKKGRPTLVMPREYGVWAMFLAPFLLGVFLSDANVLHLLAGFGLLCGFIAANAVMDSLRQPKNKQNVFITVLVFGCMAGLSLAYPLISRWQVFWPVLFMGLFFFAAVWLIRNKCEHHFMHDLLGIIGLTMLLPIAAGLGDGAAGQDVLAAMMLNVAYFTGSMFFVKSVFREQNNVRLHFIGTAYHLLLFGVPFLLKLTPLVAMMFLPGLLKMVVVLKGTRLAPKTVGIIEVANVVWFLVWGGFMYV
jgi:hypothetical protein